MPKMFMSQFEATSNFSNNAMSIILLEMDLSGRTDQMIRPI